MAYYLLIFGLLIFNNCSSNNANIETKGIPVVQNKDTYRVNEYTQANKLEAYSVAVFAGGCFWCTEAAFERIDGVVDVISGYSGGTKDFPSYKEVGYGITGHAEAIYIYYDSSKVSYNTLLDVLWVAHDPTTLNRQGPDVGEAYRSAIYYKTNEELDLINKSISKLNESKKYKNEVVTEVKSYEEFWVAESYHQNFYELNPNQSYVKAVSRPKVEKVLKAFPELIKKKYK